MPSGNRNIFLSGATGLAGTSIIREVLNNNPSIFVKGTYRRTMPFIEDGRISYVKADLTNKVDCRMAVEGCKLAIMAAASTGGAGDLKMAPNQQLTNNLVIDALLLDALHTEGVKRIIYISSSVVYQEFDGSIREDELDWNKNPYEAYLGVGWAKRSAEKLCWFWHKKYGMEIIVVRCSNIYGPHSRFDPLTSNFIPGIIRKCVNRMNPLEVWGSPKVERDVIYADDFAKAVMLLMLKNNEKFGIYNLGYGKTVTVSQVVDLALRFSEHQPSEIIYDDSKPTTVGRRALDCEKIQKTLKWKPQISLDEGMWRTVNWWKANRNWWKK